MAKQLVNPLERHVEKLVLGLAAVVLLYAIAMYLVTTPNTLELGQDRVTPANIDLKVAQKANDTLDRIRTAQPKAVQVDPVYDRFASSLALVEGKPLPGTVIPNPEVPIFDPSNAPGRAKLATVLQPAKPTLTQGRSTIPVSIQGQTQNAAVDWVTVSVQVQIKDQMDALKKAQGSLRSEVTFGLPEVQRRARGADGSWSEGDWKDITPWPAATPPKEPKITIEGEGAQASVSKDELRVLEKYLDALRFPTMQRDILRPKMPAHVNGAHWKFPLFGTYREVLLMDDEILHWTDPPASEPEDIYGLGVGAVAKTAAAAPKTPELQMGQELVDAQKMLEDAKINLSVDGATSAFNKAFEIKSSKEASAALKQKAEKFMKEAEQTVNDLKRKVAEGGKPAPAAAGGAIAQGPKRTTRLSVQQLWANDAKQGSIINGETYQYRIRVRIYNNLAGMPEKLDKPQDAAVFFLSSAWSEPSEPVTIEPASYFFVTADEKAKEEIKVEFFRWFEGEWLKAPRAFKATIGTFLAENQRTPFHALDDVNTPDNPEVAYSADATVLDIDFDHQQRERKPGSTPKGARFASALSNATQVVLMDNSGRLVERIVTADKASPKKKEIETILYKPPKPK